MRPCISIKGSVYPSARLSVSPSVNIKEKPPKMMISACETHRITRPGLYVSGPYFNIGQTWYQLMCDGGTNGPTDQHILYRDTIKHLEKEEPLIGSTAERRAHWMGICLGLCTVVQKSHESRCKYWATRSSCSLICLLHTACCAPLHSFVSSPTCGKVND